MRQNSLRAIWAQQGAALGGWLTLPSSVSAEVMAHCGFDWVCIDLQHGLIDYSEMVQMLQGISSTATVPLVRVPWNEPGIIVMSVNPAFSRSLLSVCRILPLEAAGACVWACIVGAGATAV